LQTDVHAFTITVDPLNDAPVATGDASLTLDEDTSDTVSLSFTDVDLGANSAEVSLSASNGTLTLATIAGLAFTTGDGTADAAMVFTGNLADRTAAIATVTYPPDPDYRGNDTIVFTVDDLGNSGAGGAQSDTHNVNVTVDPVNDEPELTSVDAAQLPTADEDTLRTITYAELLAASDASDVDSTPVNF